MCINSALFWEVLTLFFLFSASSLVQVLGGVHVLWTLLWVHRRNWSRCVSVEPLSGIYLSSLEEGWSLFVAEILKSALQTLSSLIWTRLWMDPCRCLIRRRLKPHCVDHAPRRCFEMQVLHWDLRLHCGACRVELT